MKSNLDIENKIMYSEFICYLKNKFFKETGVKFFKCLKLYKVGNLYFHCVWLSNDYFLLLNDINFTGNIYHYNQMYLIIDKLSYIRRLNVSDMKEIMTYEISS